MNTRDQPAKLTRKGEATRLRIVAAAAQLMYENGVAGTTMEDVKTAARASSSQLYHYFADKQALVLAVIDYQNESVVGGQEAMFVRLDSIDGLRTWRDFLIQHQRDLGCRGGCPIGSLGSELAEINPDARTAVSTAFLRWEAGIRGGLQAMHERGELTADPDELALTILAALQGGLLLTQIHRDVRPLEVTLDAMISHVEAHTVVAGASVSLTRSA
ncbi:TetR/AcrR family transcriptional regulator [Catenulispora rubra]|uniref:TetR/AcrR family transcriptional regulator n=1 Tax=Catenulispora rubra TaxID=280293 RepID=UPI0018924DC6|nr:TetR/AcrR family transcriptional regulator [Catenulispora rubra]